MTIVEPSAVTPESGANRVVFRVAEAARQVGVATSTLRAWDRRYGLGPSLKSRGAHRRYSMADVERLQQLRRLVDEGMPTAEAARFVAHDARSGSVSFVHELRCHHPTLTPAAVTKRALTTITRAVEDEWGSRGGGGVLVGGFQRERFYRQSQNRWCELGRGADLAIVLADFAEPSEPAEAPLEVPVAAESALLQEWFLVTAAPGFYACLAGWERPAAHPSSGQPTRMFETLWTVEPAAVGAAMNVAARFAEHAEPDRAETLRQVATTVRQHEADTLAVSTALTNRMVGYLAADR